MQVAAGANRPAKTGGDFVIAQIDVGAASGAVGRCRLIADFMFTLALETRNDAVPLPAPNELLVKRQFFRRRGRIVFEFKSGLRRVWRKRATALPANRALRGHVLHLLKAAVRAFHTGLGRRRFGHAFRKRRSKCLGAGEGRLG